MELLRGLLKWIILAILIILVVVLVIKYANKSEMSNNKKKEPTVSVVKKNNQEEEISEEQNTEEENLEPIQEDLTVNSPDTSSTGISETIIGIIIIGSGLGYVYKHRLVKENS